MKKNLKILIAGAGITGIVLANLLANKGHKIIIIDKKEYVGGLCHDEYINGVLTHTKGPHYFHTNNKKVWDYLSKFTEWITKDYIVKSRIGLETYDFPINTNTINKVFKKGLKNKKEAEEFLKDLSKDYVKKSYNNSEEIMLGTCGETLYSMFFEGYTKKMWNKHPRELDASICARIPIRTSKEEMFHTDKYQGIPKEGYTVMFNKMLNHKNIKVLTSTHFTKDMIKDNDLVIFTGAVDEFFDWKHGKLPYRSLRFEINTYDREFVQENAQINFPTESIPFTRIVEIKHVTGQVCNNTTLVKEIPCDDLLNPMYPVLNEGSKLVYEKYAEEAEKIKDKVLFCGRLSEYVYKNIDRAVLDAMELAKRIK